MRQFIPDAPLRQATPQHHREQKPHHAQAGKVLQATLLLLPLRTVLHTREQQLARIHLLYHAQAYPLAHLVSLLAVAYSIPIGMFLSALLHGLTLSVVCQKGYPFVCSGSPFLLFEMYWGQAPPNRRQVKPLLPEASKRREAEGRSERPAMERPAACRIASPTNRSACLKDKRPPKPCAKTTT